ncbi:MAG TPA: 23S rRNA (uracil(1939)-C(5))-methyltransferase RlmD [Candidatus Sulfotelmatobacter sp.]|nr:23S rRNA (uracil(1939)-C(5))-methyltransferase RlmD [Candidatus Sulfotelmatobacter sp.]
MLLTIEKLIYGGDGLARLPAAPDTAVPANDDVRARGKAVFVPFVLAGEKIEASLTEQKSGFARARVDAVVEPSPHRIQPACPYFTRCGGCHYQHASYEHQLEIKKEILRENLRRIAKLDSPFDIEVHPSPPWNYRNRSRLQIRTGQIQTGQAQHSSAFAAGYFKLASHELLPVEQCPISSPLINRGIASLWHSGRAGKVPTGVREVEFFANADDTQLLVDVGCAGAARRAAVRGWAEELRAAMPEITGVVAFREPNPGDRKAGAQEILVTVGVSHLTYQTQRAAYRVSAGSFFQTNRHLTDELVKIVTAGQSGKQALDLYAGVGLFSTALSDFYHVISVEPSQTSTGDLSYNQPSNGETVQATAEEYLARAENSGRVGKGAPIPHTLNKPDLVVVDPPRSGLGERVARSLASLGAPRVFYVSCDPATLARDLVPLLAAGYRVEQVHLVDLFPQTYHLESVVHLVRNSD